MYLVFKRLFIVLAIAAFSVVSDTYAQSSQRFFTLSAGTDGDSSDAMHEAMISEIKDHAEARDACALKGKLYARDFLGNTHAKADAGGCITAMEIKTDGEMVLDDGLTVTSGGIRIGDKDIQDHALEQPNMCEDDQKLTWNGTNWSCVTEMDPEVGSLVSGKWCAAQNGQIVCDRDTPSTETDVTGAVAASLDGTIRDFARKDKSALVSCNPGEVLTSDGSNLLCASFEAIAEGALVLDHLADVEINLPAIEDLLYFDGNQWVNGPVVESWAKEVIDNQLNGRCNAYDVLTYDGDKLACVADIGGPGNAIILDDLGDVSGTVDVSTGFALIYTGSYWEAASEADPITKPWAKTDITNLTADACGSDEVLTYNGSQLTCIPDVGGAGNALTLNHLSDVSTTVPNTHEVLAFDGSTWVNATETDPNVQNFARVENPLPSCPANHMLTADGGVLSCVSDAGSAADAIALDDLSDVSITTPVVRDLMVYNGTGWVNASDEVELWARTDVLDHRTSAIAAACDANEVLTFDGTQLRCQASFSDNTTYVARAGVYIVDQGEALPAAIAADGDRTVFYGTKNAFRSGTTSSGQWADANIGHYSFAFGEEVAAAGAHAVAFGRNAQASGSGSFALGRNVTAAGDHSFGINLGSTTATIAAANTLAVMGGSVGLGTVSPNAALEVSGSVIIGNGAEACSPLVEGGIRYHVDGSGNLDYCDGTAWLTLAKADDVTALNFNDLGDVATDYTTDYYMYIGLGAGASRTPGAQYNIGLGQNALTNLVDGDNNLAIGYQAGSALSSGSGNILIGHNVEASTSGATGELNIGNVLYGDIANGLIGVGRDPLDNLHIEGQAGSDTRVRINAPTGFDAELRFAENGFMQYTMGHENISGNFVISSGNNIENNQLLVIEDTTGHLGLGAGNVAPDALLDVAGDAVFDGTVTIAGALNVSGTQSIDGVVFANGGVQATGNISAGTFTGDGSGLTGVTASAVGWEGITDIPAGVTAISNTALSTVELTQLQNINDSTISEAQFGYLGALDQAVGTTATVQFDALTTQNNASIFGALGVTGDTTLSADALVGGTLTVMGALNVSGTQTIDGVVFAGGGIEATGNIAATTFSGDGSALTGVTASAADWYDLTQIPTGVVDISNTALLPSELTQLQNIDTTTISASQFGYLGAMDQSLATTDDVTFNRISGDGSGLTGVVANSADWYRLTSIPLGVSAISNTALVAAELAQLQNIDSTVIGAVQFGYLGAMDQGVATTDTVSFAGLQTAGDITTTHISASGNITANAFAGDGSGLTGLNLGSLAAPGSNGEMLFNAAGDISATSTVFVDAATGRLGIGTTTPKTNLDVVGSMYLSGTSASSGPSLNILTRPDGPNGLNNANTKGWHMTFRADEYAVVDQQNDFGIWAYNGTTTGSPHLYLDHGNGHVGIGLTTPSTPLHVNGTITATSFVGDGSGLTGINAGSLSAPGANGEMLFNAAGDISATPTVFVDAANGRLGVGTKTPVSAFQVASGNKITVGHEIASIPTALTVSSQSEESQIVIGQSNANRLSIGWAYNATPADAYAIMNVVGDNNIGIATNAGNVGIGTASPNAKLYVDAPQTGVPALGLLRVGSTDYTAQTNNVVLSLAPGVINVDAPGIPGGRLKLDADGRLGVGTAVPTTALDVSGTVTAAAFVGDGSALTGIAGEFNHDGAVVRNATDIANADFLFGSTQLADTGDVNHDHRMFFDKSKGAFRAGRAVDTQWDDVNIGSQSFAAGRNNIASGDRAVALGTANSASNANTFAMGNGNIASGVTSVAIGRGNTSSGAESIAIGTGAIASGELALALGESVAAAQANTIAIGNVLAASGLEAIALGSHANVTGNGSMALGLGRATAASGVNSLFPTVSGNNSFGIFMGDRTGDNITAANTMAIMGGNVGIGTTAPNAKLDVAGTVSATAFIGDGSALTNLPGGQWGNNAGSAYFDTGNVGIGTSSPSSTLHVIGQIEQTGIAFNTFGSTSGDSRIFVNSNATYQFGAANSNGSEFYFGATPGALADGVFSNNAGTERMRITDAGKVGIGTASPEAQLDVSGTLRATGNTAISSGKGVEIIHGGGDIGYIANIDRDLNEYNPMRGYGETFSLYTGSTTANAENRLHITQSGEVGIGTAAPNAALDVSGTVKVAGTGAELCDGAAVGTIRFNSATGRMQICRP